MTAPVASTVTKRGRWYIDHSTGARYPSVTTVIDRALSKPALNGWYAKTTATRAVDQMSELSRRVRLDGPEAAIKWLAEAPRQAAGTAAVRGSDLHDLAERHARGEPPPADIADDVRAMLAQYETFLHDFQPTIERTEMTVLNRTLGYGGTCDAIMRFGVDQPRPVVVDYKTGRTGPYAEWAIQLAAYGAGECVLNRGKTVTEAPMPDVDQDTAIILRIRPDCYELHEADLTGLVDVFAAMLTIHQFTEQPSPFTRRLPGHADPSHWEARIQSATTVNELLLIWQEATAVNAFTDDLLNQCATRKAQINAA